MSKLRYVVLACVGLGAVLLYLLSRASSNTASFGEHYTLLIALNILLVVVLAGLIGYQIWIVRKRIRERVFGARLTMRLIIMFALMAVVPGTLIYGVSVQFLSRSIESWFDVRVDSALALDLCLRPERDLAHLGLDLVDDGSNVRWQRARFARRGHGSMVLASARMAALTSRGR